MERLGEDRYLEATHLGWGMGRSVNVNADRCAAGRRGGGRGERAAGEGRVGSQSASSGCLGPLDLP